jgi:chromosome condensin MukBEF complex kleisin-like MukF subunit
MELHLFFRKYANIPLSGKDSRFLKRTYNTCSMSPQEIYDDIRKEQKLIDESQKEIEQLLEFADKIIK